MEDRNQPRDPTEIPQSTGGGLYTGLGLAALVVMGILFFATGNDEPTGNPATAENSEPVQPNTPPPVRTE